MRFAALLLVCVLLSCSEESEHHFIIQEFELQTSGHVRDVYQIEGGFIYIIDDRVLFMNNSYQVDSSRSYQPPFEFSVPFVLNDSLYLVREISRDSVQYYSFNGTGWSITQEPRFYTLFEDEQFRTTSCCTGEWGGSVFFIDKTTLHYYSSALSCAQSIVKRHNSYYVISTSSHMRYSTNITQIPDPTKMYELPDSLKTNCQWWTAIDSKDWVPKEALVGTEKLLDTLDLFFAHSFVKRDTIYFLADYSSFEKGKFSFVGSLINDQLTLLDTLPIQSIWGRDATIQYGKKGTLYAFDNNQGAGMIYLKGDTINIVSFKSPVK